MKCQDNQDIRYFLYARRSKEKSDKEEKVASTESQKKEMLEVAERDGLHIVKIFEETKSAKTPYIREEFNKMIKQIEAGKANGILCWKIDRLARNPVDEGTIKYLLQKGIIKNIKSSDRDWYPDDNSLLSSVEFGVATQYSRDLSKHVKRGLRAKAEDGHRPSLAPTGYKNSRTHEKGKETVLVDDDRFDTVRKIFDLMLTGNYTTRQLTIIARDEFKMTTRKRNNPICLSHMYALLSNPFYYGDYEFPAGSGLWHHGKHKPMITKEEYDRVQFLIGRKGKERPHTHEFSFTGLMHCGECGAQITAEEKIKRQQNGNVHRYVYYHCTKRIDKNCSQGSIEVKDLEKQIAKFLKNIEIPRSFHDWALETLKEMNEAEKKDRSKMLFQKQDLYNKCVKKIDTLLEMRLAEQINNEDYKAKKSELEQEKTHLKSYLDEINERVDDWLKKVESALDLAETACSEFERGDLKKKRQIISSLGYNHLLKDKILNIQLEKPMSVIKEAASEVKSISDRLEPPKDADGDSQMKQNYAQNSRLCGMGESNSRPEFGKLLLCHLTNPASENYSTINTNF